MAFSQAIVDDMMTKCGRHCCICRRFAPLHLQVHHIIEQADGGTDDPDNGIPTCLTCHSDVHTDTKLTRRFTVQELKQHRDLTFRLVAEGKLRAPDRPRATPDIVNSAIAARPGTLGGLPSLSPEALRILITAAIGRGDVMILDAVRGGMVVESGGQKLASGLAGRDAAMYRAAADQLVAAGFIEITHPEYGIGRVTYPGYLAADQYMAAGAN